MTYSVNVGYRKGSKALQLLCEPDGCNPESKAAIHQIKVFKPHLHSEENCKSGKGDRVNDQHACCSGLPVLRGVRSSLPQKCEADLKSRQWHDCASQGLPTLQLPKNCKGGLLLSPRLCLGG